MVPRALVSYRYPLPPSPAAQVLPPVSLEKHFATRLVHEIGIALLLSTFAKPDLGSSSQESGFHRVGESGILL
jgi:hypothetical protein